MRAKRGQIELSFAQYEELKLRVLSRDGWKCRVPGCKARQGLQVHHIIFRSQGGPDASWNLITVCNYCHNALHSIPCLGLVIATLELDADKGVKWKFIEGWKPRNAI